MKFKSFVGIDVSKKTIDVVIKDGDHRIFNNSSAGFSQMVKWLEKHKHDLRSAVFCFENTGIYSLPLCLYFSQRKLPYVQVPGLAVNKSMGLKRGKSDRIDAQALADYAYLHRENLELTAPLDKDLVRLKQLFALRNRMVKQRAGFIANIKEMTALLGTKKTDVLIKTQSEMMGVLSNKIAHLEEEMFCIIKSNEKLNENLKLATSVKGIGLQTALLMLITTNNFTSFRNARSFACYAGIAPFEHQSGISYKGKVRVSQMANKQMKTLLGNAAATAIQFNPELKAYYNRRLAQGKHKMSTLNIIRNKLVGRVFAAVTRKQPYVDICKFAA